MPSNSMIAEQVYLAASDGGAISIVSLLDNVHKEVINEVLNLRRMDYSGQICSPLLIAIKHGHAKVVKMLINRFGIDLELVGDIRIDNNLVRGASPLWCASAAGHLNIVKILVSAGADVNHMTDSQSTPVRAACYNGRLDIVKYLVEHGADIHRPNRYHSSCLMIASYKGHLDIVKFLLENGADVDQKAKCGSNSMHFAAECGHIEVVKELRHHGVRMDRNLNGVTPLLTAAERTRMAVVEYFLKQPEISKLEKIEALELLGASFANDKDNYSLDLCYIFLYRAMLMRFEDPDDNIIPKPEPIDPPNPAYGLRNECKDAAELFDIKYDDFALQMESLIIRERILGKHNPDVAHSVVYRGAVFADNMIFDRCILLWLHGLNLAKFNHLSVGKDLLRFAQVFSHMICVGLPIKCDYLETILTAAVRCLSKWKENNCCEDSDSDPRNNSDPLELHTDEMELCLIHSLFIVTIITRVTSYMNDDQIYRLEKCVYNLIKVGARTESGYTLLHLAVDSDTPVEPFHIDTMCDYPCPDTVKLLIKCGADVDAMDNKRNTPLHIISAYSQPIRGFPTLHSIIMDLLDAGAHSDFVNRYGQSPLDTSTTGVADILLKTKYPRSLKCFCAKQLHKYDIPYVGVVPKTLEKFVNLHGPGSLYVKYRKCGSSGESRMGCYSKK